MRLTEFLKQAGLTQAEFAVLANVNQSQISRYLHGEQSPGRRTMLRIREITSGRVSGDDWLNQAFGPLNSPAD